MVSAENYIDRIISRAQTHPEQVAVIDICNSREVTYFELKCEIEQYQFYCLSQGIKAGDIVLLSLSSQFQTVVTFYALTSLGAVSVFVNPEIHSRELAIILASSGANYGIFSSNNYNKFEETLSKSMPLKSIIVSPETIAKEHKTNTQTSSPGNKINGIRLAAAGKFSHSSKKEVGVLNREETEFCLLPPLKSPGNDAIVSVNYTYKGLGKPIPVPHTYGNYNRLLLEIVTSYSEVPCGEGNTNICILPLHSTFGLVMTVLLPIFRGAKVIFAAEDITRIPCLIYQYQADMVSVVPALLKVLGRMLQNYDSSSYQKPDTVFLAGGSKPDPAVIEEFVGTTGFNVVDGYGTTEILPFSTNLTTGVTGSIGNFPMAGTEVQIRDCYGCVLEKEVLGQIWIKVPWRPLLAWNNDDTLAEFFEDGWFNTGDLGYIDQDGHVFITARHLPFTKIKGIMVDLVEIETLLKTHPAIASAKVFSVLNADKENELVCHLLSTGITKQEVKSYLRNHFGNYKIPKTISIFNQ